MTSHPYPLFGRFTATDRSKTRPEVGKREPSDHDLMVLVKKGDEKAFDELFDRYFSLVRRIAKKLIRNPQDVDDAVQETFLKIHQYAKTFDSSKGTVEGWISSVAYHQSVDVLECLKKNGFQVVDDTCQISSIMDVKMLPDRRLRILDFRRSLNAGLEELNEKQRLTIWFFFYEDKPLAEIATMLGDSFGNVRHHFYRGLEKLEKTLVQNGMLQGYTEFSMQNKE